MEIALIIVLILLITLFFIKKQKAPKVINNSKNFKELVRNTFPKYRIIEKNQMIMICEYNHRNEPEELVFIRIDASQKKKMHYSGRMLIADYPYMPSAREMKSDFARHLK